MMEPQVKYPKFRINDDYVDYAMNVMDEIYQEIGFRTCGTKGEEECTEKLKKEYSKHSDEVNVEEFQVANQAYPAAMIRPIGWFFLISNILYYIIPSLSWIVLIPLILWILELIALKQAVDWMYPKSPSQNVFAKIKPKKETRTIIVFAGHQDSPYIFPITAKWRHKGQIAVYFVLAGALLFVLAGIIRGIMSLTPDYPFLFPQTSENGGWIWVDFIALIGPLILIPTLYITQTFVSKEKSFGANDNLSGTLTALALAKYFKIRVPDFVELWFVAFGSEEAGQRGSHTFALKHKEELLGKDAYLINFECVGGGDLLLFVTKEMMCIPPRIHSSEVYNLMHMASEMTSTSRDCRRSEMMQGYSDAEAFSRVGLKASTMIGLNFDGYPKIWHHPGDIPSNIERDLMGDCMSVAVKCVEIRDREMKKMDDKKHPKKVAINPRV